MTSRLNSGLCLRCGNPLIVTNDIQCCTVCTEFIGKQLYQLNKRIERKDKAPKRKTIVRRQIARQIMPIGEAIDGSFGSKI